ncbi:MAG TPA: hypothetical protein VGD65_20065 [Chryseosolibacter sp.]
MKKLFAAISLTVASVPGLAIIAKGIGTPPGHAWLFGGIIEAIGALAILLLWINRDSIRKISPKRLSNTSIYLGFTFFVLVLFYLFLFKHCVVTHPTHETVYFPLWTDGRAKELISRADGRWSALDRYGNYPLEVAIGKMDPSIIVMTTTLLLVIYQGIFTCLVIAFGLLAIKDGTNITPELSTSVQQDHPKKK